ncbi:MAG: outer membrane protein assembly factor BamD [Chitinophagales bacterium]|nr:outer membrane protein assembly factor BamD [Chitinophagales bacterium]
MCKIIFFTRVYIFLFLMLSLMTVGCVDTQKVINSNNKSYKFSKAKEWFEKKKYSSALPLIEHLIPYYKGTDTAEVLYFYLAESYFQSKEYFVAAYHYNNFNELYGKGTRGEYVTYQIGECYFKEVPRIELDQSYTNKAIDQFKTYLKQYPSGKKANEAFERIESLYRNIELKALQTAELYYHTRNYRAAVRSFENLLNTYPNIKEYESIHYKIIDAKFQFAKKSIPSKQVERYEDALNTSLNYLNKYPNSPNKAQIMSLYQKSNTEIINAALNYARSHFPMHERSSYYLEAISVFKEYYEFSDKNKISEDFPDQCYYYMLEDDFFIVDNFKEDQIKKQAYQNFIYNYNLNIDKIKSESYLQKAKQLNEKLNLIKI